jgi:hypothetical protein
MRRTSSLLSCALLFLTPCIGKNSRRSARPRQDSLPGFESSVCKVHRLMVWLLPSHARHPDERGHARPLSWTFSNSAPYLPLRRHQVSCLRADPRPHHPNQGQGDAHSPSTERQLGRHPVCLLHIPARSHSRAISLRDKDPTQD